MSALKMAKAPDAEWQKVMDFANALDEKINDGQLDNDSLAEWVRTNTPPLMRTVYGYRVLVDNCCDPKSDVLEFKLELVAAMRDSKRVDWIQVNGLPPRCLSDRGEDLTTLRESIDAAMPAEKEDES